MQGKLKRFALTVAGGAVVAMMFSLMGVAGPASAADRVTAGNIQMVVDGKVSPTVLPRRGFAPAALSVVGHIRETNGEHPQPMQRMILDFDKAGFIFDRGLPVCRTAQIENTRPDQAKQACGRALVGQGKANAEVKFPDQDPFMAPAEDLMIFNGIGRGGEPDMIIHAYAFVPLPTTFVVPVYLVRSPNKRLYRHRAIIPMPEIAGGNGSMSSDGARPAFNATIRKLWNFRGQRRSYIYAGCPRGVHRAEGLFQYRGGPTVKASVAKRCTPRGR